MKSFDKLLSVMARLRSPKGCPWDRKQTHESLLKYLLEESEELKQGIRKKDVDNIEEELGDVLFQVIFHAQIAKEKKQFSMDNVIKTLIRKLTLRHPHVFGYKPEHRRLLAGRSLNTSKEVLANWDLLKQISKKPVKSFASRKRRKTPVA